VAGRIIQIVFVRQVLP